MRATESLVGDVQARVTRLVALLEPAEVGPDRFVGERGELNLPRAFGGEVLAQALVAAARTVAPSRPAHSLHAYFLRAGDPRQPVEYRVGRVRDGRRLACRSVSACQDGAELATVLVSFADTAGGVTHRRPAPAAPPPDSVSTLVEASRSWGGLGPAWLGFDVWQVHVDPVRPGPDDHDLTQWTDHVWQRMPGRLPDDPVLHQALLVYASDVMQLASALVPHGVPIGCEETGGAMWDGVSLDHAVWFHRPCTMDDWLLFEQCSPVAAAGRALTRAEVFTTTGDLVATVIQEGLIVDLGGLTPSAAPPERG